MNYRLGKHSGGGGQSGSAPAQQQGGSVQPPPELSDYFKADNQNMVNEFIRINPQTNILEPILWKKCIFPFQQTFDPAMTTGALTIPATGQVTTQFKIPYSAPGDLDDGLGTPLRVKSLTFEDSGDGTAAANFTIMLRDLGDKTQFMNNPIHILNFAGTAQLAAGLSEPLFMPTLHVLQATYAKISGSQTTARMYMNGQMYFPWDPQLIGQPTDKQTLMDLLNKLTNRRTYIFPFWLTTDQQTPSSSAPPGVIIPANGTIEVDTDIGDDGHFEATHLMGVSTGSYNINILNPQTKMSFTNGQIASGAGVGTAQNPQKLAVPWLIPASSRIRFQFTDTSGSSNTVYICLRGLRIRAPLTTIDQVKQSLGIPASQQH